MSDLTDALEAAHGERLAWVDGDVTVTEKKDFDASEARDDHGRWTSGGGSSASGSSSTGGSSEGRFTGGGDKPGTNEPGENSHYTDMQKKDVTMGLDYMLGKYPEVAEGDHPLAGVAFQSGAAPAPLDAQGWDVARGVPMANDMGGGAPLAMTLPLDGGTSIAQHDHGGGVDYARSQGNLIVMNDVSPFRPSEDAASSDSSTGGAMVHEFGHAYFSAHGIEPGDAGAALNAAGITPEDLSSISNYAASSASEGMAEMFGMANTPGHELSADLQPKYEKLLASMPVNPVKS